MTLKKCGALLKTNLHWCRKHFPHFPPAACMMRCSIEVKPIGAPLFADIWRRTQWCYSASLRLTFHSGDTKEDGNIDLRRRSYRQSVKFEPKFAEEYQRGHELRGTSLQVVSMTITERATTYVIWRRFTDNVKQEFANPDGPIKNTMGILTHLLYTRFKMVPIRLPYSAWTTVPTMELARAAVLAYADAWCKSANFQAFTITWAMNPKLASGLWSTRLHRRPIQGWRNAAGKRLSRCEMRTYGGRTIPPSYVNAADNEYLVMKTTSTPPAWASRCLFHWQRNSG